MHDKIRILLYLLLAINVCYVLSGAIHLPMQSVDVLGLWLFKAKAIFIEGGLPLKTLNNPDFFLFHPQYPLLLPFLYSLFYLAIGRVWELPILLLYPIYYVVILWLVFKVLKNLGLTSLASLIYVYLYSMFSPLLGQAGRLHAGSADIVIVLLGWLIVYLWQQTQLSKNHALINQSVWLITLLVMVASQIKLEGLFLGAIILILPITKSKKMLYLLVCLLPTLIWTYMVKSLAIPVDFTFVLPGLSELAYRVWLVVSLTAQEMVNVKNWYIFWPLFCLALAAPWSKKDRLIINLGVVGLLMSGAYVLVYLTVTTDVYAHITSSIDRVLFQLTPVLFPIFVFKSQQLLTRLVKHS